MIRPRSCSISFALLTAELELSAASGLDGGPGSAALPGLLPESSSGSVGGLTGEVLLTSRRDCSSLRERQKGGKILNSQGDSKITQTPSGIFQNPTPTHTHKALQVECYRESPKTIGLGGAGKYLAFVTTSAWNENLTVGASRSRLPTPVSSSPCQ